MSQRAPRDATYADVLAAPPHMVAEVIDGSLHLQPRPMSRHARAASAMGATLGSAFDVGGQGPGSPGGWILMVEPELHLGSRPDILVPDLAGWREERYPHDLDDDVPYLTLAPDWVCEVLSESTSRVDRMKKVPIYAREGVVHVWLADPRARTVEVYQLGEARYELVGTWGGDEEPYVMPPFDAVSLSAASIWGRRIRR